MTGSSFRGPPDEKVACVRVERVGAIQSPTDFAVAVYLPRGVRGIGPAARWALVERVDEARAEGIASSLSDVLWHAREDGARELRDGIRRMRDLPDDTPIPACVCGDPDASGTQHRRDGPCYVVRPPLPPPRPPTPPREPPARQDPPVVRRFLRRLFRRCP